MILEHGHDFASMLLALNVVLLLVPEAKATWMAFVFAFGVIYATYALLVQDYLK